MDLKLKDKTAFISGSTSGIGYAVAKILLREGMSVYINGRSQNSVDTAISQLKNEVIDASVSGIVADFNQPSQISKIFKTLSEVNVLINNVGIYSSSSFFATSVETWQEQFQVNVMSGVSLSKYYMKKMLHQNWGRILFISSECAYLVPTDMISYSTTKAALHATSRGLAQLARGTGVTSNVVVPGSTLSVGAKFFLQEKAAAEKKSVQTVEENFFRNERSNSLLQRFATTDEVATTIAYLCSPLSSATNGTIVKVDGGSSGGI